MMEAWIAGFFGLLLGSFLNVCIYRLPRDLSVVAPRSHCPECEKLVAWYDNIPVLSWLLLRGKCRHCGWPIPWRYPVVELLTGILFFWSIYSRGWNVFGVKNCIISFIMVDLIFTDLADRILPDEFTLGGALIGLVLAAFTPGDAGLLVLVFPPKTPLWLINVVGSALAGIFCAGLLWLAGRIYYRIRHRDGMGLGDVKMLLAIGTLLGLSGALLTFTIASVSGALVGGLYIWLAKEEETYEIPFGSFLGIAAIIVAIFGEHIMAVYWKAVL